MPRYKVTYNTFYDNSNPAEHQGFIGTTGSIYLEAADISQAIEKVKALLTNFCGDSIEIYKVKDVTNDYV